MENINDYEVQIKIAKIAQNVLNELNQDIRARFTRWFHLRPTSKNITIVTTHPSRPMRGISVGRTVVKDAILFIVNCCDESSNEVNWDRIAERYNAGKGFEVGFANTESPFQADMINHMSNNRNLKKMLGVQNIYFNASEVVFARGYEKRSIIDVVAHDNGGKVFLFELKSPENNTDDPVKQVTEYLEVYGKGGPKNQVFEKMMANYPQNPIKEITDFTGYGVVGYSECPELIGEMLIVCT